MWKPACRRAGGKMWKWEIKSTVKIAERFEQLSIPDNSISHYWEMSNYLTATAIFESAVP